MEVALSTGRIGDWVMSGQAAAYPGITLDYFRAALGAAYQPSVGTPCSLR